MPFCNGGMNAFLQTEPIPAWNDLRASWQGVHHVNQSHGLGAIFKHDFNPLPAVEGGVALQNVHPGEGSVRDRQQLGPDIAAGVVGDEGGVSAPRVVEPPPFVPFVLFVVPSHPFVVPSCPFVSFRVLSCSFVVLLPPLVFFVLFVVSSCPLVSIRVHSWFPPARSWFHPAHSWLALRLLGEYLGDGAWIPSLASPSCLPPVKSDYIIRCLHHRRRLWSGSVDPLSFYPPNMEEVTYEQND